MKNMKLLFLGAVIAVSSAFISLHKDGTPNSEIKYTGTIEGIHSGNYEKVKMMNARELKIVAENAGKTEIVNCIIDSFTFAIAPLKINHVNEVMSYLEIASGPRLTSNMTQRIKSLKNGDIVIIGNIHMKLPDGSRRTISGSSYTSVVSN